MTWASTVICERRLEKELFFFFVMQVEARFFMGGRDEPLPMSNGGQIIKRTKWHIHLWFHRVAVCKDERSRWSDMARRHGFDARNKCDDFFGFPATCHDPSTQALEILQDKITFVEVLIAKFDDGKTR